MLRDNIIIIINITVTYSPDHLLHLTSQRFGLLIHPSIYHLIGNFENDIAIDGA